jgi:hypothetical protein
MNLSKLHLMIIVILVMLQIVKFYILYFMNKIYIFVIIILASLLIIQQQCHRVITQGSGDSKTVTIIKRDTSKIIKIIEKPVPVSKIVPGINSIPDTFYLPYPDTIHVPVLDTAKVRKLLQEYLTRNVYNRVLMNDTNAYIELSDTIYRNELLKGFLTYINRRPTQIITSTTTGSVSKFKFYVGGTLGGNISGLSTAGIKLLITTRNYKAYDIGTNLLIREPNINFSFYWQIHKK